MMAATAPDEDVARLAAVIPAANSTNPNLAAAKG